MRIRSAVLLLSLAVGAACGGAQTSPSSSVPSDGSKAASAWDSLTPAQKKDKMRTAVLPKMSVLFHDFDTQRYAKVTCATCHPCLRSGQAGYVQMECSSCHKPDGMPEKPKMPSAGLPKLTSADGFKLHKDRAPKTVSFMMTKVVPQMASLIGEQPYDPETKKGFGCFNCHVKAD
jgi:cytochrome c peroxidase